MMPSIRACPRCKRLIHNQRYGKHMKCPGCRIIYCHLCLAFGEGTGKPGMTLAQGHQPMYDEKCDHISNRQMFSIDKFNVHPIEKNIKMNDSEISDIDVGGIQRGFYLSIMTKPGSMFKTRIKFKSTTTIREVKQHCVDAEGGDLGNMLLIFKGRYLVDDRTIGDYAITTKDILCMVQSLRGN